MDGGNKGECVFLHSILYPYFAFPNAQFVYSTDRALEKMTKVCVVWMWVSVDKERIHCLWISYAVLMPPI